MSGPLLGFARAVDLAQRDLVGIAARLDVIHTEAWLPAAPDRDRPTPHRPVDPSDPDFVAAAVTDCGLGSHKAKVAWGTLVGHLDAADLQSAHIVALLSGYQSGCAAPCRPTSLLDAQFSVRRLQRRFSGLQRLHDRLAGDRWLTVALTGQRGTPQGSPCHHVELAFHQATQIVAVVGNGQRPPICSTCRRVGSVGQPRKGGKCDACHQRKWRLESRQRRATVRAYRAAT